MNARSAMLGRVALVLGLCLSAGQSTYAAPPPVVAKDPNWYKAAIDLQRDGLQALGGGQTDTAISKFEQALRISEENKSDDYVMLTLGHLIEAYGRKRDTVKVEELYLRYYDLAEKNKEHSNVHLLIVLNQFGDFYRQLGQFDRARPLLERAVAMQANASGPGALGAVAPLNNLASLCVALGELDRAAELLEKAITIQEGVLGKDHLQIAPTLSNLAIVAHHRGDLDRAEEIDRRACKMLETAPMISPMAYPQCLSNLGFVLQSKGELTQAKELVEKSIEIQRRVLGASHPRISLTLTGLGQIQQAMGDLEGATRTLEAAIEANDRDLDAVMVAGSEAQKKDFFGRIARQTEGVVSLHLRAAPTNPAARSLALQTILRRKGRVLDAVAQNVAAMRQRMTGEQVDLLDKLSAARTDLARAVLGGVGAPPPGSPQQKQLEDEARLRIDKLERELGKRSVEFRRLGEEVTIENVQASLPKDAVLIEFVRYHPFNPKWKKRSEAWEAAQYAAYVLTAAGEPLAFDLGLADKIDEDIKSFRAASSDAANPDFVGLANNLDAKLLRPIFEALKSSPSASSGKPRTIYLSPDGGLNVVPFAVLMDEHGKHRLESLAFDYLTSGRDLLHFNDEAPPSRQRPFVLANADFGPRQPKGTLQTSFAAYFPPLPGTVEEGKVVSALLPGSTLVTESKAIEQTVKALHGPEALHLATHGFFRGEPPSAEGNTRALELEVGNVANTGSGPKTLQVPMENPLLRSGLALAGANVRTGQEDGILTALEVSGMDLWGTKLAVLSACETGLGDVSVGEGVYGLRRSLAIAGAQTILMSLWEVDDEATRDLMIAYYQRMAAGEGRVSALRTAQLSLLHQEGRAHPFYWGAFLASGDPRPVEFALAKPQEIAKAPVTARGCACDVVGQSGTNSTGLWLWWTILAACTYARPRRRVAETAKSEHSGTT
ncbi:MAG TPA: CHAT domain-containing protein [Polyangium sp.]|nr:CHAT domain-containing protein [Polyangium sp.]